MKTLIFRIIILSLLSLSSHASIVTGMYEVTLPVMSQDKKIQQAAFEQAFIEVLVRISGSSLVVPKLNINQASKYVQQYRYLPIADEIKADAPIMLAMSQPKHLLWIEFNEGRIQNLLRENGLSVWGQQRPDTLVWMVVRDGKNRYVLRDRDQSVIKDALEKEAQRRGLPIIWPKFDEQDRNNVLFADLWGSFWEPITVASERYRADAILVGRMNWIKGSWQVGWSMQMANASQSWELNNQELASIMAAGIDMAADTVSSRFAVLESGDNAGQLLVQINGINHLNSYAKASRYLSSLAPVKNLYATQIEGSSVHFNVDMTGGEEDLRRIIALGKTLEIDTTQKPAAVAITINSATLMVPPVELVVEPVLTYRFKKN